MGKSRKRKHRATLAKQSPLSVRYPVFAYGRWPETHSTQTFISYDEAAQWYRAGAGLFMPSAKGFFFCVCEVGYVTEPNEHGIRCAREKALGPLQPSKFNGTDLGPDFIWRYVSGDPRAKETLEAINPKAKAA